VSKLINTGERLHAEALDVNAVEHLHRYAFASDLIAGQVVLDIACGEGYGSNLLAARAKSLIGVDISEEAVRHASTKYQRPNLEFRRGSADQIPLEPHSVDCVTSFETLEHHTMHEEMLAEIKRVIRPGGLLIMSTPDKLNYTDRTNQNNEFHVKELYTAEFKDLISRYFRHADHYFQRASFCGMLTPAEPAEAALIHYSGDFTAVFSTASMPEPIYNVAIASDGPLPARLHSVFEGTTVYESLRDIHAEQTLLLKSLRQRVENADKEIGNLRGSLSLKIGRVVTWPLRLLGGRSSG